MSHGDSPKLFFKPCLLSDILQQWVAQDLHRTTLPGFVLKPCYLLISLHAPRSAWAHEAPVLLQGWAQLLQWPRGGPAALSWGHKGFWAIIWITNRSMWQRTVTLKCKEGISNSFKGLLHPRNLSAMRESPPCPVNSWYWLVFDSKFVFKVCCSILSSCESWQSSTLLNNTEN